MTHRSKQAQWVISVLPMDSLSGGTAHQEVLTEGKHQMGYEANHKRSDGILNTAHLVLVFNFQRPVYLIAGFTE